MSWVIGPTGMDRGVRLLAVGATGACVAQIIGIPAGVIVGSLLASGVYRLAGADPEPWRGRFGGIGRLLLGTVIGATFGPDVLVPLKTALLPMTVVIMVIVGVGLGLGWVMSRFTSLDTGTALISAVPGGLPAMAAIADDTGADATVVAAIHFSRLMAILMLIPALIPLLVTSPAQSASPAHLVDPVGLWRTALTLAIGLGGGLLLTRLGVPTGELVGSILAVAGVNLLWAGPGPLAAGFRQGAMILIGTAVGAGVDKESLGRLRKVALPAGVMVGVLIGTGLILGWGLSRVTSLDLASAMLSSVPGGASTMPAVAHDLGGDMRLVAALHLMRQLVIFILLPSALGVMLRRKQRRQHASSCHL